MKDRSPVSSFTGGGQPLWPHANPHSKAKLHPKAKPEGYFDEFGEESLDPIKIEKFFEMITSSSGIPVGYIRDVGGFLKDINTVIRSTKHGGSHQLRCSVLSIEGIQYIPEDHSVIVHNILIRPGVWGLGFFHLVLLQLITSCYKMQASLWILNPSNEMIRELREISPKFHSDENQDRGSKGKGLKFMILDFKDTERAMGGLFSGNSMIDYDVEEGAIVLDERYHFPSSKDLNKLMGK